MAKENIGKFLNAVMEDEVLKEKFQGLPAGNVQALIALAEEAGFEVAPEDFAKVVSRRRDELSDDDLEKVAGGMSVGYENNDIKLDLDLKGVDTSGIPSWMKGPVEDAINSQLPDGAYVKL